MTMGRDLGLLMRDHLKVKEYLALGHDIGSMVAVGLTLQFRENVQGLMIMGEIDALVITAGSKRGRKSSCITEGPSPGTKA